MRGVDAVTFTYWWHGENLQIVRPANEATSTVKKSGGGNWAGDKVWRG